MIFLWYIQHKEYMILTYLTKPPLTKANVPSVLQCPMMDDSFHGAGAG